MSGRCLRADFLRAGPEFGATTLSRFYAIHMLLVPGAIIALIGAHMYLVVKLGTTAPPWVNAERPKGASPLSQLDAGANGNGRVNGHRVNGAPVSGEGGNGAPQ